jgi:anti-sigma regulatory factor (Ser/Thr protein kinase)
MSLPLTLPVTELSQVGDARRRVAGLASEVGLGDAAGGRLALVVTETATNLVRHGQGGLLLARALARGPAKGIEVLALDRGPGIANLTEALRDGYSTAGTPGTGLGAVRRLSTTFDVHSVRAAGTAVLSRVWEESGTADRPPFEVAGVSVPYPGEEVCGDAWGERHQGGSLWLIVADGLGHGSHAADAARAAVNAFLAVDESSPQAALQHVHGALRPTRGAAVAIARVDAGRRVVRFAGIGNIAGCICGDGPDRHLVSHGGIAGHEARRIEEFTYPWPPGGLLVLHSDGIATRWDLERYAGLARRHPALVAGVLYRDFARGRDDATVVVARAAGP